MGTIINYIVFYVFIGMEPSGNNFRNIWSAAYINDCWRFVDCHWGARHVDKSRDPSNGMFCYSLDEFFFLTNPEDMVNGFLE